MHHFVLILNARFGFNRIQRVRADRYEVSGAQGRFWQGERLVYQAPAALIEEVVSCAHGGEADAWIEAWRVARRSDGGMKVEEYGVARRQPPRRHEVRDGGQGSPIVEGVSLTVVEPMAPRRRSEPT